MDFAFNSYSRHKKPRFRVSGRGGGFAQAAVPAGSCWTGPMSLIFTGRRCSDPSEKWNTCGSQVWLSLWNLELNDQGERDDRWLCPIWIYWILQPVSWSDSHYASRNVAVFALPMTPAARLSSYQQISPGSLRICGWTSTAGHTATAAPKSGSKWSQSSSRFPHMVARTFMASSTAKLGSCWEVRSLRRNMVLVPGVKTEGKRWLGLPQTAPLYSCSQLQLACCVETSRQIIWTAWHGLELSLGLMTSVQVQAKDLGLHPCNLHGLDSLDSQNGYAVGIPRHSMAYLSISILWLKRLKAYRFWTPNTS